MSLLLGIVLFVVIGLCIALGALASYHSWIIFGETGGWRGPRASQSAMTWRKRAHAYHLLSLTGLYVFVLALAMCGWLGTANALLGSVAVGGGMLFALAAQVASDHDRRANRLAMQND